MNITNQQYLLVALPFVFSYLNTTFVGVLAQKNCPDWINATIAWIVLIAGAFVSMYAAGKFTGGLSFGQIIDAFVATVTLLMSGALVNFKPYAQGYILFLKNRVFNVVKPVQPPTPIVTIPKSMSAEITNSLANREVPTPTVDQTTLPQVQTALQFQRANNDTVVAPTPLYDVEVQPATNPVPRRASASPVTTGGYTSNATFDDTTPTPRRVPQFQPNHKNGMDQGG